MGLENSNPSQPLESSGQPAEQNQPTDQATAPQPSDDSLSPNAPSDSSLLSMMPSLTPHAPATSGDSVPQYPSLEAAVEIEQPIAPTLTNLLAAQTQETSNLSLGTPGITMSPSTGSPDSSSVVSNAADNSPNPNPTDAMSDASMAESPAAPALSDDPLDDEQGPLAGEAIAVERPDSVNPDSAQPASPTPGGNLTPNDGTPQDASWNAITQAITQGSPSSDAAERSSNPVADKAADSAPAPSQTIASASQASPATEGLTEETETETEPTPAKAEAADSTASEAVSSEQEETVGDPSENEDFDQVKERAAEGDRAQQVLIKREDDHVAVIFPKEAVNANPDIDLDFIDSQLWQDLQQRLSGGTAFASNTPVHLYSQNSLLDTRQLQELDEALGRFNLKLVRIITSRRQTAVAAAMSGYSADQTNALPELLSKEIHSPQKIGLAEPLYLQKNIRSGTEIRHPGSVIVMGDLNPGSSVIADGDILVWGRLRGIAHAGAAGDTASIVMALKLEAPQLRIAGAVARVDTQGKGTPSPEIAYINDKSIRITSAYGFNRNESS